MKKLINEGFALFLAGIAVSLLSAMTLAFAIVFVYGLFLTGEWVLEWVR